MAQSFEQTLPSGYLNAPGGATSSRPFKTSSDNVTQWHYDTSEFNATGPILINEIYVRVSLLPDPVSSFDYSDLTITLIEASTDYASHHATFANNITRAEVVRTGPFVKDSDTTSANGLTGGWIPLRLEKSFLYDPTSGNDLIVELRTCGVNADFGALLDGAGGNCSRHGYLFNCTSTFRNFTSPNSCPIVKIDYTPVLEQTLPVGQMNATSNSASNFPVNTPNDQIWQWHYDSSNFNSSGPITISQVSVRANASAAVNAFEFSEFEVTLIEASTDYVVGAHNPTFTSNILRGKIVRDGVWKAPATPASGTGGGTWISFQLVGTFDYDPSTGNDFIVQIRSCSPVVPWGTTMDGKFATGAGNNGGNRYGNTFDCMATTHSSQGNEFVPTVKISFTERDITTFPYRENFDHFGAKHGFNINPPGWQKNTLNVHDWRFSNKSTILPSAASDHTTGKTGLGFYATTRDNASDVLEESLETPIFNIASLANPVATFWIYSYSGIPAYFGANTLHVAAVVHNANGTTVETPQALPVLRLLEHKCWTKFAVKLDGFGGNRVSLRIHASTNGNSANRHDFAIDDFTVDSLLPSEGGQPARPDSSLNINACYTNNGEHIDSGADGPYYACGKNSEVLKISINSGPAYRACALWIGPQNIGVAAFGAAGQMDAGIPDTDGDGLPEALFPIANGFASPPSILDTFFITDFVGELEMSFQISPFMPSGILGTFQAAVSHNAAGLFLTNAVTFSTEF